MKSMRRVDLRPSRPPKGRPLQVRAERRKVRVAPFFVRTFGDSLRHHATNSYANWNRYVTYLKSKVCKTYVCICFLKHIYSIYNIHNTYTDTCYYIYNYIIYSYIVYNVFRCNSVWFHVPYGSCGILWHLSWEVNLRPSALPAPRASWPTWRICTAWAPALAMTRTKVRKAASIGATPGRLSECFWRCFL